MLVMKRLLITLILSTSSLLMADDYTFNTKENIYVIGDIHGAYDEFVTTLKTAGLVDEKLNWTGGASHLVSLGDIMDRGPRSRDVIDLIIELQQQSEEAGGKVHVVLGNHEVMIMQGDWRYLSAEEIAVFAKQERKKDRKAAYEVYLRSFRQKHNDETLANFDATYPPGFFAHMQAHNRKGKYGKWILKQPFVIKINDNLFTHGGLSPAVEKMTLEDINESQKDDLKDYLRVWEHYLKQNTMPIFAPFHQRPDFLANAGKDRRHKTFIRTHNSLIFSPQATTWYRGNALCHPYFEEDRLKAQIKPMAATRLWVGHTTTVARKMATRLSGALIIMDTGMLASYYRGQPWIAKIKADSSVDYIHGQTGELGVPVISPVRDFVNPYRWSDKQVEDFLLTAEIVAIEETEEGRTNPYRVTLRDGKREIRAIFKHHDTEPLAERLRWKNSMNNADRYQYEVAAYKLDRMLGIGLVPVTVERKVNDEEGVLQLWIDDLISYLKINEDKIPYEGMCELTEQINFLDSFDYLIANKDRNQSNILFSKSDLQIWFIDHSRAFSASTKRPVMLKKSDISVSPRFKRALKALTDEQLETLRPWLNKKQVEALAKRRDKMIRGKF